jgi:hypothetical protein
MSEISTLASSELFTDSSTISLKSTASSSEISSLQCAMKTVNAKLFDYIDSTIGTVSSQVTENTTNIGLLSTSSSEISGYCSSLSTGLTNESLERKAMDGKLYAYILELSGQSNNELKKNLRALSASYTTFVYTTYPTDITNVKNMIYELSSEKQGDLIAGDGIAITPSGTSATIEVTGRANLKLSNIDTQLYPSSITSTSGWGVFGSPDVVVDYWIAQDGSGWYRKYRSGWVEQGGWQKSISNSGNLILLSYIMKDIVYAARNIQTSNFTNGEGGCNHYSSSSISVVCSSGYGFSWYAAGIGDAPAGYEKYTINLTTSGDTYSNGYFVHALSSDNLNLSDEKTPLLSSVSVTGNILGLDSAYTGYTKSYTNPTPMTLNSQNNILLPSSGRGFRYVQPGFRDGFNCEVHLNISEIKDNQLFYSIYFNQWWDSRDGAGTYILSSNSSQFNMSLNILW